jgi:hypothetical protein
MIGRPKLNEGVANMFDRWISRREVDDETTAVKTRSRNP